MTRPAILTERSLMRVISFVACKAIGGRVAKLAARGMTRVAGRRLVRPFQLEVRKGVIESLRIKKHDIGVTALVIGVACFAFRRRNLRILSMEAAFSRDRVADLLMAFEAEAALLFLRECFVTAFTIFFELAVGLDDVAWGDQLFK